MAVANLDGAQAERIALFVENLPASIRNFHLHPVNIRTVDFPKLRRLDFERHIDVRVCGEHREGSRLGGCNLVVRLERGYVQSELLSTLQPAGHVYVVVYA